MEVEIMKTSGIIFLDNPITVDINDWLQRNNGIVAVGHKLPNRKKAQIYAYSKCSKPTTEISKLARKNNSIMLVGVSDGDINAID